MNGPASWRRTGAAGLLVVVSVVGVRAQDAGPETREALIVRQQAQKAKELRPYVPGKTEARLGRLDAFFLGNVKPIPWHPFIQSAYSGGGFTLGAGYRAFVNPNDSLDFRGSYSIEGYKRVEAEFLAPHVRRGRVQFSALGGWREATQVGFYGIGTAETSEDDRVSYGFEQPYVSAMVTVLPRRPFVIGGGVEYSQWKQEPGSGDAPSIETVYDPAELPGLGASPTYLHTQAHVAIDTRPSADYARHGTLARVAFHSHADVGSSPYSFRGLTYEAIQHVPILNDAWVLSFRGRVETTDVSDGQAVPFFMLPALGGGSLLRGFSSWRFRDRHSVLVSAEWRVLVNRFLDLAAFYDAGKVVSARRDLDLTDLKSDYGLGLRLHGPATTPLRIELARSNEQLKLVFSSHASF